MGAHNTCLGPLCPIESGLNRHRQDVARCSVGRAFIERWRFKNGAGLTRQRSLNAMYRGVDFRNAGYVYFWQIVAAQRISEDSPRAAGRIVRCCLI